jgi:hypothetical protein
MTNAVFHFIVRLIIVHVIVYFVVHGIIYEGYLISMYDDPESHLPRFIRSPEDHKVWAHVWRWILPLQVLRAFLVGMALSPFYLYLKQMTRSKRFLVLFVLFLILGGWSSYIPGPGSLEGLLHLHPDIHLGFHLAFLPLLLLEALLTALGISMWTGKKNQRPEHIRREY